MPASSRYPHRPCAEHLHTNGMAPHTPPAILASPFTQQICCFLNQWSERFGFTSHGDFFSINSALPLSGSLEPYLPLVVYGDWPCSLCEEMEAECSSKTNALMNPSPRLPNRRDQVGRHWDQAPGASNLKTSQQGTHQAHANHMLAHAGHMLTTRSTRLAHG